jgi:hypothetical protein
MDIHKLREKYKKYIFANAAGCNSNNGQKNFSVQADFLV